METRTRQGDSLDCLFPLRQLQKMHAARAFASKGGDPEDPGTVLPSFPEQNLSLLMQLNPFFQRSVLALGVLSVAVGNTGCETNAATGAALGAAVGAGIGALTGDEALGGALIGAAVGAVAGHAIKAKRYKEAGGHPESGGRYPTGSPTSNPSYVKSPYSPYNVIDVSGFRSGDLAIDPTTDQVFRVP